MGFQSSLRKMLTTVGAGGGRLGGGGVTGWRQRHRSRHADGGVLVGGFTGGSGNSMMRTRTGTEVLSHVEIPPQPLYRITEDDLVPSKPNESHSSTAAVLSDSEGRTAARGGVVGSAERPELAVAALAGGGGTGVGLQGTMSV